MAEIKVRKNGPYLVTGVALKDAEGNPIHSDETFALCRCGRSAAKPFCDGTHKRVGFDDSV
jgi:CDGSH-type Zn-finger protein